MSSFVGFPILRIDCRALWDLAGMRVLWRKFSTPGWPLLFSNSLWRSSTCTLCVRNTCTRYWRIIMRPGTSRVKVSRWRTRRSWRETYHNPSTLTDRQRTFLSMLPAAARPRSHPFRACVRQTHFTLALLVFLFVCFVFVFVFALLFMFVCLFVCLLFFFCFFVLFACFLFVCLFFRYFNLWPSSTDW